MKTNNLLNVEFPVLDKGFIRLVDYMGSDDAIVQAARVSYGKGTKSVREDETLIRYLMRHKHTSPFEQCELKFHVKVPMDCWRQWIRHRTASVNEYSTRYSEAIDDKQQTEQNKWRLQDKKKNLQGSEGFVTEWPEDWENVDTINKTANNMGYFGRYKIDNPGEYLTDKERHLHEVTKDIYNERLEFGVAREQARKDLPLSTYTMAYWKIDLHNLLHFLSLRMDSHAQLEIRSYASIIGNEIVAKLFPLTWTAFQNYRLNAITLSQWEIQMISLGDTIDAILIASDYGWIELEKGYKWNEPHKYIKYPLKNNLERIEFENKCEKLNIKIPWKKE